MKRYLFMIAAAWLAMSASAEEKVIPPVIMQDGIAYEQLMDSQTRTVTGLAVVGADDNVHLNSTEVTIPAHIPGYSVPVTRIDSSAFADCRELKHVTIANTVVEIGQKAFSVCPKLTSITTADPGSISDLTTIGPGAFGMDSSLTEINLLMTKVSLIGPLAFYQCTNLKRIVLSETPARIEEHAFQECPNITDVISPCHNPGFLVEDAFDGPIYDQATLTVNPQDLDKYKDHANGAWYKFLKTVVTGVDDIEVAEGDAPVEYYTLTGMRVMTPQPGQLVVRRCGTTVTKELIR